MAKTAHRHYGKTRSGGGLGRALFWTVTRMLASSSDRP